MSAHLESELPAALRAQWPYEPRYANVNGWRMHYVDEGRGDPVVLLHGNPTWGFLYRKMIPLLVGSGRRVVVPDIQCGNPRLGLSHVRAEMTWPWRDHLSSQR